MPKFVDYHNYIPPMPPEAIQDLVEKIQSGAASDAQMRSWDIYVGMDAQAWCVCDAPDAWAVVQAHESVGFDQIIENVAEVLKLV